MTIVQQRVKALYERPAQGSEELRDMAIAFPSANHFCIQSLPVSRTHSSKYRDP